MKRIRILSAIAVILVFVMTNACKESFLEITPNGALDEAVLATYDGVDGLLIGAYSMVDGYSDQGTGGWEATNSGWVYGSIRGMEANKGTDSGDQPDINPIQKFEETATNPYLNSKWRSIYEAISRCNSVIRTATNARDAESITADQFDWFVNQARVLRGFYHFEAWRLWANMETGTGIPYIDTETIIEEATNSVDVRPQIIADLEAGINLPNDMGQVGRFNKTVAQVLTAKAEMQMNKNYSKADGLLASVIQSGTNPVGTDVGLEAKYGDIFDVEFRNGVEAIYTVQYSVNDGSGGWNAGQGEVLNFPYKSGGSPGGCCGFFNPTQDFVNSFRTDASGLPMPDSYNDEKVINDQGLAIDDPFTEYTGNLDPRLDWSVGRRGIPYLDWGDHTGQDWIRDQSYSGPYNPKKQVYKNHRRAPLQRLVIGLRAGQPMVIV
jgi:murein DD-endopeptidase MepM/ murein hydrolase activator NlpD